jgi:hypothetical protein
MQHFGGLFRARNKRKIRVPMPARTATATSGANRSKESGMGMSRAWAEWLSYWGNWALVFALVLGVLSTFAVVIGGNVKEAFLNSDLALMRDKAANTERGNLQLRLALQHEQTMRMGRALRPDQIAALQGLRGKVKELTVVWSRETEPSGFGMQIATTLMGAGVAVRIPQLTEPGVRDHNLMDGSVGISVYEPSDAPQPRDLLAGPVAKAFTEAGFNPSGSARPVFAESWADEPIIMVGGKQYEMLPGLTR